MAGEEGFARRAPEPERSTVDDAGQQEGCVVGRADNAMGVTRAPSVVRSGAVAEVPVPVAASWSGAWVSCPSVT